jgi:hypothetical protein
VERAAKEVNDAEMDPVLVSVFGTICEAMRGICSVQDKIVTAAMQNNVSIPATPVASYRGPAPEMVSLGATAKRPRAQALTQTSLSQPMPSPAATQPELAPARPSTVAGPGKKSEDPVKKRFKDAIRDAERSTLVLNLNMGRLPIMNREAMSKKATLALTAAAAAKEERTVSYPCEDSIAAIDDVLSVVKNISFFGAGTKSYKNPRDELSGSYCTAPVKYEFKDKETKLAAEKIIKDTCGVSYTTPYPTMVRECIKQIIADVKKVYPDNFIRVNIDTDLMVFKVARKPPKDAKDNAWHYGKVDIPIPEAALDINTRKVPKDFKLEVPEVAPNRRESVATVTDAAMSEAENDDVPEF